MFNQTHFHSGSLTISFRNKDYIGAFIYAVDM